MHCGYEKVLATEISKITAQIIKVTPFFESTNQVGHYGVKFIYLTVKLTEI